MTSYSSFIRDFSMRCKELLIAYEDDARQNNREVTLLISVATSAFIIPFERLRPSAFDHVAEDRISTAVGALSRLENRDFVSWQQGSNWEIIEDLDGIVVQTRQADDWANPANRSLISSGKKVGAVLGIIRNALAHGNIFIYPNTRRNGPPPQIGYIIFLSKLRDPVTKELVNRYNAVFASPADFRTLILDWITFLGNIQLPSEIHQEQM